VTAALGERVVVDMARITPSEDFGLLGQAVGARSLRFFVGAQNAAEPSVSNHSPRYAPQAKTVLPLAVRALVVGVMDLQNHPLTPKGRATP
jgi:hypothetical protein